MVRNMIIPTWRCWRKYGPVVLIALELGIHHIDPGIKWAANLRLQTNRKTNTVLKRDRRTNHFFRTELSKHFISDRAVNVKPWLTALPQTNFGEKSGKTGLKLHKTAFRNQYNYNKPTALESFSKERKEQVQKISLILINFSHLSKTSPTYIFSYHETIRACHALHSEPYHQTNYRLRREAATTLHFNNAVSRRTLLVGSTSENFLVLAAFAANL